jgi:thiamine-monophosphate kinase
LSRDACARYGIELAGGDLAGNDRITGSLTLLGQRPAGGRWLERRHGRPGDNLWVTGDLGLSALGRQLIAAGARRQGNRVDLPPGLRLDRAESTLARRAVRRHLTPTPQLQTGLWLGRRRRAAAIDVSDGLAIDLHRLSRESGVRARLDARRLRVHRAFAGACAKLSVDPLAMVLGGGEDYALLFAISPRVQPPPALDCRRVGRLEVGSGVTLNQNGKSQSIPALGWDHFDPPDDRS